MIKWAKALFYDKDGDADEMATCVMALTLCLIVATLWSVAQGKPFSAQDFGIGAGALIGAAATGMGFKSSKENKQSSSSLETTTTEKSIEVRPSEVKQ